MKLLKMMSLIVSIVGMTGLQAYAQLTAADVTVKVNKEAKKLEVIKKADNSNITASFKLTKASIDIFDSSGEYAGSLELKDWAIPLDEFAPDEIVKVASITMVEAATGATIELKDIRLEL